MLIQLRKKLAINSNLDFYYNYKYSKFFMKNNISILSFYLPSIYFYRFKKNIIEFIFVDYFKFKSFLNHLSYIYNNLIKSYFIKIKIKGLGYRIRFISNSIFYFFFNYTNYFYLFKPLNMIIKVYKRKMFFFSLNWYILKLTLSHIFLLRKIGSYNLQGIRFSKQIIYLKKGGKKV